VTALRTLAPGKVNLCLFLGGVREDGRHELVTLFQPVSLADEVVLSVAGDSGPDVVVCPGVEGENLAARALADLRARGWEAPPVRIEIVKRIPVAAGMAGGSADAAAVLRLAAALGGASDGVLGASDGVLASVARGLGASDGVLASVARGLGADVPSQLAPAPALGTGAGEVVVPVPPRAPHAYVILPSAFSLSTAAVFAEADRLGLARGAGSLLDWRRALEAALEAGPELPAELLVNDLEPAARSLCPTIDAGLDGARSLGADAALVCGSGPTVAGIFWGTDAPARARAAAAAGAARFPGAVAAVPVDAGFASVEDVECQPRPAQ
jgi:4-diphosphocytidyl-2-C-methyl-D-erythritol kinase